MQLLTALRGVIPGRHSCTGEEYWSHLATALALWQGHLLLSRYVVGVHAAPFAASHKVMAVRTHSLQAPREAMS